MWQIIVPIFYLVSGLFLLVIVALKPKLFWPILIAIVVGANGLIMFPRSSNPQALVDEYFTGCILLGCLLAISIGAIRFKKEQGNIWDFLYRWILFLLISYMIIESIRGLLLWGDLRLIRWVLYYSMLGTLAFILSKCDLPFPNIRKTSLIIVLSLLIYFAAYLTHGLFTKYIRGISVFRLDIQGYEWMGGAAACFPLIVAMPAAIFIFKYGPRNKRWLNWTFLFLTIVIAYFYDVRSAFVTIMAFLFISPSVIKWRQTTLFFIIVFGLLFLFYKYNFTSLLNAILETVSFKYSGDVGRWSTIKASINATSESLLTFFFGYGIHSHHFILGPYLKEVGHIFPQGVPSYVRVTGFGSLFTDLGLIGILLIIMNFLILARKFLFQKNNPARYIFLLSLFLPLGWILFSKIEDMVLLWLMIMPSGLLTKMAQMVQHESAGPRLLKDSPNPMTQ